MIYQDFSNWGNSLFLKGVQNICTEELLIYDMDTNSFRKSADYQEKVVQKLREQGNFWILFSIGVEFLAKVIFKKFNLIDQAVFVKYEIIDKIMKKKSAPTGLVDNIQKVYDDAFSTGVISSSNLYLQGVFTNLGIKSISEINAGTLGGVTNSMDLLKAKVELVEPILALRIDFNQLKQRIKCLADVRRNVDLHIFLNRAVLGEISKDLSNVYLPLINDLLSLYNTE
jgi:hypothetical protein